MSNEENKLKRENNIESFKKLVEEKEEEELER